MKSPQNNNSPFSEVIESSLTGFTAQSWNWNETPSFGSLVVAQSTDYCIYGIVHQVQTGSSDPNRVPHPFGKTHAELMRDQPQIFQLLRTTFSCIVVGYEKNNHITYTLNPHPAPIHTFISHASLAQSQAFFSQPDYVHILFNLQQLVFNLDELLLATIAYQIDANILRETTISSLMDTYALLTGNEYRRTKLFLQRVQHTTRITP